MHARQAHQCGSAPKVRDELGRRGWVAHDPDQGGLCGAPVQSGPLHPLQPHRLRVVAPVAELLRRRVPVHPRQVTHIRQLRRQRLHLGILRARIVADTPGSAARGTAEHPEAPRLDTAACQRGSKWHLLRHAQSCSDADQRLRRQQHPAVQVYMPFLARGVAGPGVVIQACAAAHLAFHPCHKLCW